MQFSWLAGLLSNPEKGGLTSAFRSPLREIIRIPVGDDCDVFGEKGLDVIGEGADFVGNGEMGQCAFSFIM